MILIGVLTGRHGVCVVCFILVVDVSVYVCVWVTVSVFVCVWVTVSVYVDVWVTAFKVFAVILTTLFAFDTTVNGIVDILDLFIFIISKL